MDLHHNPNPHDRPSIIIASLGCREGTERGHGQSVSGAGPNDVGDDGVRLEMIMLTTVPYQPDTQF